MNNTLSEKIAKLEKERNIINNSIDELVYKQRLKYLIPSFDLLIGKCYKKEMPSNAFCEKESTYTKVVRVKHDKSKSHIVYFSISIVGDCITVDKQTYSGSTYPIDEATEITTKEFNQVLNNSIKKIKELSKLKENAND